MKGERGKTAKVNQHGQSTELREVVSEAKILFHRAMSAEEPNRKSYVNDITLSSTDNQWPDEIATQRGNRVKLSINRLNGVVKQIEGDYRKNDIQIKVRQANREAREEVAEILDGLILNIQDQSKASIAYATALSCAARGGFGYFRIVTEYADDDGFDQDIRIRRITNPLTVYFDPSAEEMTKEDARFCFVTDWMDKKAFRKKYPNAQDTGFSAGGDDKAQAWEREGEIRVAEFWRKEPVKKRLGILTDGSVVQIESPAEEKALKETGQLVRARDVDSHVVRCYKITALEVLEVYDWPGRFIPIIPVLGEEVDIEGKRFYRSAIYYAKDSQHMFNYWQSAATEAVALAPKSPWLLTAKHLNGYKGMWDNAHSTNRPYLLFNHDPAVPGGPNRIATAYPPIAEMGQALQHSDNIKATTGLFDRSLGGQGNETSGRAILAVQQEGDTATFIFPDNLGISVEYCGRQLVDLIPKVYDTERMVRIKKRDGKTELVEVNKRQQDPVTGEWHVVNDLTAGKYDVAVTTGPAYATQKMETAENMIRLAQVDPRLMQIGGDIMVGNLDFPQADDLAKRYKRTIPPQILGEEAEQMPPPPPNPMQQAQVMVAQGEVKASLAESEAKVVKAQADMAKARAGVASAVMSSIPGDEPGIRRRGGTPAANAERKR